MTGLPLPANSAAITVEWLNEALGQTDITCGATISAFEREVIGEGAGFVGELTRIKLTYDRLVASAPASLVAKLPTADEAFRSLALLLRLYEREIHFYEEIASEVELRTPHRYFSAMDIPAGAYVLLLEDLAPARCGDQLASCSSDEATLALTEIAKFHAAWWNNARVEEFTWMPAIGDPTVGQLLEVTYQQSWPSFVERYGGQVPESILDIGERFGAKFGALIDELAERPETITHTDFRLDNMFFRLQDGSPFAVIDWQLVQRGGALLDVVYFLAGNFPPHIRRQHETTLLRAYHQTLLRHGVTGYDFDDCVNDYRAAALFLMIFLVTNQENLDINVYDERGQALMNTVRERYSTAILDLNAAEFLPD